MRWFRVKQYHSGFILNPGCLAPRHTVDMAIKLQNQLGCSGIPVTENGHSTCEMAKEGGWKMGADVVFFWKKVWNSLNDSKGCFIKPFWYVGFFNRKDKIKLKNSNNQKLDEAINKFESEAIWGRVGGRLMGLVTKRDVEGMPRTGRLRGSKKRLNFFGSKVWDQKSLENVDFERLESEVWLHFLEFQTCLAQFFLSKCWSKSLENCGVWNLFFVSRCLKSQTFFSNGFQLETEVTIFYSWHDITQGCLFATRTAQLHSVMNRDVAGSLRGTILGIGGWSVIFWPGIFFHVYNRWTVCKMCIARVSYIHETISFISVH